jgi:GMP synthase (glutamine-hydrolysing)
MRFLIIDGYTKASQDQFREHGVPLAYEQYERTLQEIAPGSASVVWLPSQDGSPDISAEELSGFDAVLWTGCNKTIYHDHDPHVMRMRALCHLAYEVGTPQFGSCWALQIAVVVAGGRVEVNPKGREMGIARKIQLTGAGRDHPMFAGKPSCYDHFVSHDDEVTELPPQAELLAGNSWSEVQAAEVRHLNGVFWATQYHCEYKLYDVARLIRSREERLLRQGVFTDHDDLIVYADRLEALSKEPERADLRWQLVVDEDILNDERRQREFRNFIAMLGEPS